MFWLLIEAIVCVSPFCVPVQTIRRSSCVYKTRFTVKLMFVAVRGPTRAKQQIRCAINDTVVDVFTFRRQFQSRSIWYFAHDSYWISYICAKVIYRHFDHRDAVDLFVAPNYAHADVTPCLVSSLSSCLMRMLILTKLLNNAALFYRIVYGITWNSHLK